MRNRLFFFVLSLAMAAFILMGCGVADDAKRLVGGTEGASPTDAQPATTQGTPAGLEIRLLSPAPNSTDVDPEGTELSWKVFHKGTTTEATGLRFEVYLSTKNPPDVALKNDKGEIVFTSTKVGSGKLLAGTTYYWQVVAKDLAGKFIESEVRSFKTKEPPAPKILLVAPTDGAKGVDLKNVTLRWDVERPADFAEFEVLISTSTEFSGAFRQKTKNTSAQIEGPFQKSMRYLWKVIGYLTDGRTVESGVFSFETIPPSTPVFVSGEPKDNHETASVRNVEFSWKFTDADGDDLRYIFELFGSLPSDTATPLVREATVASEYKLTTRLDYDARYYWRVLALDVDGNEARSPIFTFSTPKFPLPENPKPSNAAQMVPIETRELSWEYDVSDVTKQPTFVVFLGESEEGMKALAEVTSTSVTLPATLSFQTTYFWKVVVKYDGEVFSEGPLWRFRTQEPPKLIATNPANGGYLTSDRKVSWQLGSVLPSDYKLRFVLATSTEMPPIQTEEIQPTSTEVTIPKEALVRGKTYFWTLLLTDNNDRTLRYPWSSFKTPEPVTLKPPKILEPKDGAEVDPGKVAVKWEQAAPPELARLTYDVLVGTEPGSLTVVASGLERTTFEIPDVERGRTYFVKIVAKDEEGSTSESETYKFSVTVVRAARGISPKDMEENVPIVGLEFSWDGDETGTATYELYLGTATGTMSLIARNLRETSYKLGDVKLRYDTVYYWRVDAKYGARIVTGRTLSFKTEPLPKPTNLRPENGKTDVVPRGLTLNWQHTTQEPGRIAYDVYLGAKPNELELSFSGVRQNSVTLPELKKGNTYYWKVVARSEYGKIAETEVHSFTTAQPSYPAKPVLVSPKAEVPVDYENVELAWEAQDPDGDELRYVVYLDRVTPPLKIATETKQNSLRLSEALEPGITYYWRVLAIDEDDNETLSDVSTIRTVKVLLREEFDDPTYAKRYRMRGIFETINNLTVGNRTGSFLKITTKHASSSELEFEVDSPEGSVLQIDYYVSSEEGYDFFVVLVNGSEVLKDSGEKPWQKFSYQLSPGQNKIKLVYVKDEARSRGWFDGVLIDRIVVKSAE